MLCGSYTSQSNGDSFSSSLLHKNSRHGSGCNVLRLRTMRYPNASKLVLGKESLLYPYKDQMARSSLYYYYPVVLLLVPPPFVHSSIDRSCCCGITPRPVPQHHTPVPNLCLIPPSGARSCTCTVHPKPKCPGVPCAKQKRKHQIRWRPILQLICSPGLILRTGMFLAA